MANTLTKFQGQELVIYPFRAGVYADPVVSKDVLGGKGDSLHAMTREGLPVPPGFVIPCQGTWLYQEHGEAFLDWLMPLVMQHVAQVEQALGRKALFSVRSGAPVSMPGMMDTILNVGIGSGEAKLWTKILGSERAFLDSTRRFLQMHGCTALGLDEKEFAAYLQSVKTNYGVELDSDLTPDALGEVIGYFYQIYEQAGQKVPQTLEEQLRQAIKAVFGSWNNERAVFYRNQEGIPHDLGTAVTIQAMVFGNMNDESGSGVLFTRDPSTGEQVITGEFLTNAQGEDVVAGIRTPDKLEKYAGTASWTYELIQACEKLEQMYLDMVDMEFTVENGKLFLLQARKGKRTPKAALKIASDLLNEGVIKPEQLGKVLSDKQLFGAAEASIKKGAPQPTGTGIAAGGGAVFGLATFEVSKAAQYPGKYILITHETTPDDIMGMHGSVGILTKTGGMTSHAAVVARNMAKPCVVGCEGLTLHGIAGASLGGIALAEGDPMVIDGSTGGVWLHVGHEDLIEAGGEDQIIALAQQIADQLGIRLNDMASGYVHLAEALLSGRINDAVKRILQGDCFVDTMLPDNEEDDAPLWSILMPGFGDFGKSVGQVLEAVPSEKRESVTVAGMNFKGFKTVVAPTTVADMYTPGEKILTQDFIKNVLGGHEMLHRIEIAMGSVKRAKEARDAYDLLCSLINS